MKSRCHNPNNAAYDRYGGRGIVVCDRWRESFENFYADMGPRPSEQHSIDRINNDGNYEPGNCRWATDKQQSRNTRRNRLLTYNGETLFLDEWAERLSISKHTLQTRLWRGWSVEEAFETPIRGHSDS
ncbi:MAG TPA: hypothetical protein V6D06_14770 [Trichocoleus sp.]